MASKAAILALLAVAAAAAVTAAAPAPETETCVRSLLELSPCLPFFRDTAALAAPEGCCAGLRSILGAQALCLCHIADHTLDRAIGVDIPPDRAAALLGDLCGLAAPAQDALAGCADEGDVMTTSPELADQ